MMWGGGYEGEGDGEREEKGKISEKGKERAGE
jgi:hypothetical protein